MSELKGMYVVVLGGTLGSQILIGSCVLNGPLVVKFMILNDCCLSLSSLICIVALTRVVALWFSML